MGLLKSLKTAMSGKSAPARNDLDALFGLPAAGITLLTELGFTATGTGAVCFKAAAGHAFAQTQAEITALLDADGGPKIVTSTDSYGYTWIQCVVDPGEGADGPDLAALATDLHAVNSTLEAAGFGASLLCSLVPFTGPEGRHLALVYLYKQGTWYPFAPTGEPHRDTTFEFTVRDALTGELPIEADVSRWFPVWGAPGL
ncbi:MAG: PspA-associated protein PspAB [Sporichthyaceae bacterium]